MGVFCSTVLPLMLASALLATHGHAQTTYDEVQVRAAFSISVRNMSVVTVLNSVLVSSFHCIRAPNGLLC